MPFAAAEALAASLPDARLEVFSDCAHAPFASQPDQFIARVRQFLHD
jgi:pimeloyl-[acyl-carrier protein] methyl ester esterase